VIEQLFKTGRKTNCRWFQATIPCPWQGIRFYGDAKVLFMMFRD
jgi:hypothetical protein